MKGTMGFLTSKESNMPPRAGMKKLIVIACLSLLMLTLTLVTVLGDPVRIIARYSARVAPGSSVHELLQQKVDAVHMSAYLFNVTNAERFLAGEDQKLRVEEVGPFTYKEMRTQVDLELDLEAGVIRYSPQITPIFVPEESIADPRDINITMPNMAMLSMTSMMSTYPFLTRMAYNLLVKQLATKPIVSMDAYNYLWGYEEQLITFGNTFMPGWISFNKMGLMDRLYDNTFKNRLEVGARNEDKFSVKELNGCKGLRVWNYEDPSRRSTCNTFTNAYEGIGYPTDMTPSTPIRIFRNVLCRMLELDFHETRTLDYGAEALVYNISNRTFSFNSDSQCTCAKGTCIEGLSDLSPCFYDLPFAMSNAHFLNAPSQLYERIEGMSPDPARHSSEFLIEPIIGVALGTRFSIQLNIVVKDVGYNVEASPFTDMVVPVAYFTITQPELTEPKKAEMRQLYITGPRLVLSLQIIFFTTGLVLLAYFTRLLYWNWVYADSRSMAFQMPEDGKKPSVDYAEVPLIKRG